MADMMESRKYSMSLRSGIGICGLAIMPDRHHGEIATSVIVRNKQMSASECIWDYATAVVFEVITDCEGEMNMIPRRRLRHISTSIRGLAAMSDQQLDEIAPNITVDGKRLQTAEEVRQLLTDALAHGFEVIPAEGCDHYDARGFCMGHEIEGESR